MKKLSAFLNTPAKLIVAIGLIILAGEFLIMLLIESIHATFLKDVFLEKLVFEFLDPILLILLVSPSLLLLIFKPMRTQQVELERQLDELRRFQRLGIGRELRIKELVEEIAALRNPLSAEKADNTQLATGSPEAPRHAAAQLAATQLTEQGQRSALLFMLEDLEAGRKKIETAHQEWVDALDAMNDPVFLHDSEFRILRCNKAYQQCAGLPFKEIIGHPYYEIFPKTGAPLPCCLRSMEKAEAEEEEEEAIGDAIYRLRTFSIHDKQGAYLYSIHILENITERKQTDAAFRALVGTAVGNVGAAFFHETVSGLCAWLGAECAIAGEIVEGNRVRALAMQLDSNAVEHYEYVLAGTPCDSVAHKGYCEYPEGVCRLFPEDKDLADMGAEAYVGIPVRDKNGNVNGILCAISRHKLVLPPMIRGVFEIIAARAGTEIERERADASLKASVEALRKSNERFDIAVKGTNDGIWDWDIETNANYFSPRFLELLNYAPDELAHELATFEFLLHPDDRALVFERVRQHLEDKVPYNVEYRMRTKNGEYRWFQARGNAIRDQSGKPFRMAGSITDITGRRQAEAALLDSEEKFRNITESAQDAIIMMGVDKRISFWNAAAERIFGYTAAEALGQEMHALITPPQAQAAFAQGFPHFQQSGEGPVIGKVIEVSALHKGGKEFPVELSISAAQFGGQWHAIGLVRDITERKRTENILHHLNRALKTLGTVNHALVYATNEDVLLHTVCHAIAEDGYQLAWVGYVQHDASKAIKVMTHAGQESGYLETLGMTWADNEHGQGPCGQAVRSSATQVCQNILSDPDYCVAWRNEALKHGYAAIISLPLASEEGVFGVLCVHATEADAFTVGEVSLLEEMAADLAFGVTMLRLRLERDRAMKQSQSYLGGLRDSLEETVRAIALTVEMRDPYTAGHQRRVADLATAIATQLGLPAEQVHGIHLAGVVHDLGKINIPSEILSKPGKISEMEFGFIKTHAQAGYDILKDINFPWPIAQIVLQHHERLDGSGYPQGLKGDQIILEARILSVADVVEAMYSHRPYRPGLGLEAALAEITKQRGIYFDPAVVDACLALFREQHYAFKG